MTFNTVIRPVCLPSAGARDWSGSTGTVIGWGSIRESKFDINLCGKLIEGLRKY